jgi:exodeoxyribonuclease V alpha subunit
MKRNRTEGEAGLGIDGGPGDLLSSGAFFSELDTSFAQFVAGHPGGESELVSLAAALVSYQLGRGHTFLDLAQPPAWDDPQKAPVFSWPSLTEWLAALRGSSAVGGAGEMRPLILLPSGKLYLHRYWLYERSLADSLRLRSEPDGAQMSPLVEERLQELFAGAEEQRQAARTALLRPFSIISGGPGTGKTTTVLKILMLLLERNPDCAIRLIAPTGKAAARLQQSLRSGLEALACTEEMRTRLGGMEASTIHRLLGAVPGSVAFRHNGKNPLPVDAVILDEASMVDLPLMAKLIHALPPSARLIILGDKDQLASVEAGSVLSGIVEAAVDAEGKRGAPLHGSVTLLTTNYRFGNESGIFRLCTAVRTGAVADALRLLRDDSIPEVEWHDLPSPGELKEKLRPLVVEGFSGCLSEKEPARALQAFGKLQLLSALRAGVFGKENLNFLVEDLLREEGLIPAGLRDYPGRPLMVTENDYTVRLFNGDVGILFLNAENRLMACFAREDGSFREISAGRMPQAEPAFAMTVHKSQGSEFEEVLVILPPHDSPILTRELIYTAVSRARKKVILWSSEEILRAAITRKVTRASGLPELLAGDAVTGNLRG